MVSRSVIESDVLPKPVDKLVYTVLCMYADNSTKTAYPSVSRIAKLCGCSERSVRYALKRLEEAGFIEIRRRQKEGGGYTSNLYVLLDV